MWPADMNTTAAIRLPVFLRTDKLRTSGQSLKAEYHKTRIYESDGCCGSVARRAAEMLLHSDNDDVQVRGVNRRCWNCNAVCLRFDAERM